MVTFGSSASEQPYLRPCLKSPYLQKPGGIPEVFQTKKGTLRVPRCSEPAYPTDEVIQNACEGRMTGIFERGMVFPASDLIGVVAIRTANITLDKIYDFQTHLLRVVPEYQGTERLRNLFFVSLKADELPSFHFWKKAEDVKIHPVRRASSSNQSVAQPEKMADEDGANVLDILGENVDYEGQKQELSRLMKAKAASDSLSSSKDNASGTPAIAGKCDFDHFLGANKGSKHQQQALPAKSLNDNSQNSMPSSAPLPDKSTADVSKSKSCLIRFQLGAMYLKVYSSTAFQELAQFLVLEEHEKLSSSFKTLVDVRRPSSKQTQTYPVKIGASYNVDFYTHIRPYLGASRSAFRIRSDALTDDSPWDYSRPGSLKVSRVGIGYFYIRAAGTGWDDVPKRPANDARFRKALDFLFVFKGTTPDRMTLRILSEPSPIELDTSSEILMDAHLGGILQRITSSQTDLDVLFNPMIAQHSAEIYVYKSGEEREASSDIRHEIEAFVEHHEEAENQAPNEPQQNADDISKEQEQKTQSSEPTEAPKPSEVRDFMNDRDTLKSTVSHQELQISYMCHQVDSTNERMQIVEAKYNEIERHNTHLTETVQSFQGPIRGFTQTCQSLQASVEGLRSKVENLTQEQSRLQQELRTAIQQDVLGHGATITAQTPAPRLDGVEARFSDAGPASADRGNSGPKESSRSLISASANRKDNGPAESSRSHDSGNAEGVPHDPSPEPQKLVYCDECLKSVDKLDAGVSIITYSHISHGHG